MADQIAIPRAVPVSLNAALLAGQIRAVLPLAGGVLLAVGVNSPPWLRSLTDEQIASYISAGVTLWGFLMYLWPAVWSWRQKRAADAAARTVAVASAVASANATAVSGVRTPVTIEVIATPPGRPDIVRATEIPAAEVAIAPAVDPRVTPYPAPRPATM